MTASIFFLGIDQGTRSTKGVLLDSDGNQRFEHALAVGYTRNEGPHVEQDPEDLLASILEVVAAAKRFVAGDGGVIDSIGFACQRSGVCGWQKGSGKVLHPLITWADRSTAPLIEKLGEKREIVFERTTLPVTAHYAAGKIALLQKKFPGGAAHVGTLDSFVLYRVSNGKLFAIEDSMASRTMLYGAKSGAWDPELCRIFDVDEGRLPTIRPSLDEFGKISAVPLAALLGDQQAALLGRLAPRINAVLNLGSIASLCVPLGPKLRSEPGYITSILYSQRRRETSRDSEDWQRQYLIEAISNASADLLDELVQAGHVAAPTEIGAAAQRSLTRGAKAVVFFPRGGTGTPDWRYGLPDLVSGWDGHDHDDFVRAVVENLAGFVIQNVIDLQRLKVLPAHGVKIAVTGGISEIDYLLQYIADCADVEVVRFGSRESTARGAALAAMISRGKIEDPRSCNHEAPAATFRKRSGAPSAAAKERHSAWLALRRSP